MSEGKNGKFFANGRQQMFAARIDWEIRQRILPHLNKDADYGYPFHSQDQLLELYLRNRVQAQMDFRTAGTVSSKLPREFRDAFNYIASRETGMILRAFVDFAENYSVQMHQNEHLVTSRA